MIAELLTQNYEGMIMLIDDDDDDDTNIFSMANISVIQINTEKNVFIYADFNRRSSFKKFGEY